MLLAACTHGSSALARVIEDTADRAAFTTYSPEVLVSRLRPGRLFPKLHPIEGTFA